MFIPSTRSLLDEQMFPKQLSKGDPECLVLLKKNNNPQLNKGHEKISAEVKPPVSPSVGFCSAETWTCFPPFHSLLQFTGPQLQAQMETTIRTSIPSWKLPTSAVQREGSRLSDGSAWGPLRQASGFMALQPLQPTSPSLIDTILATVGSSIGSEIPLHTSNQSQAWKSHQSKVWVAVSTPQHVYIPPKIWAVISALDLSVLS